MSLLTLSRFRWVYCQLESIRQCVKPSALRKALLSLPKTLDETYERILQHLRSNDQLEDTTQALRWLCFSIRPLTLLEMVEILAIQTGDEAGFFPEDRMPDPADIMTVCSSLISCSVENTDSHVNDEAAETSSNGSIGHQIPVGPIGADLLRRVRLVHFSVKEYLLSERCTLRSEFQTPFSHDTIAEGCLRYLLHLCDGGALTLHTIQLYPLARYAAKYWWQHAQRAGSIPTSAVRLLASQLLNNRMFTLAWVQLFNIDLESEVNLTVRLFDLAQPLYYAAALGLPDVLRDFLQRTTHINAGHEVRSPLRGAARHGHEQMVRMLLDAGADIDAEDDDVGTALQAACLFGHENIVQVLLDAGASLYGQNEVCVFRTALDAAVGGRRDETAADVRARIVQMLVDAGSDRNSRSAALSDGIFYPNILSILLKTDVDLDFRGFHVSYSNTPLQYAAFHSREDAVRLLLDRGANPDATPGIWGSALQGACENGHSVITDILLKSGARLSEENNYLYSASERGRAEVVQVLLGTDVNINQKGGTYGYALQAATAGNHRSAMQRLLDAGAEINMQGGRFGNALQAACSDSWPGLRLDGQALSFTRRAWRHNIDPNDNNYDHSLKITLWAYEATLGLSLYFAPEDNIYTKGCDLDFQFGPEVAYVRVEEAIADVIAEVAGAKNQEEVFEAASLASLADDLSHVVKLGFTPRDPLIDAEEAEPESKWPALAEEHRTMVEWTQTGHGLFIEPDPSKGYEWTIQALLDAGGATIQLPGDRYLTDFGNDFVTRVSPDIVRSLLKSGADVNAQGGIFGNALQATSRFNLQDIAEDLLANGADINARGGEYGTALHAACASFAPGEELVQYLINAGANVNIHGGVYGSALQAACYRGSTPRVRLLLNAGADVNVQGGVYGTPLQAACASPFPQMELVRMLLNAGARDDVVQGGIGKFGSAMNAIQWKIKGYRPVIKRPAPLKEESSES